MTIWHWVSLSSRRGESPVCGTGMEELACRRGLEEDKLGEDSLGDSTGVVGCVTEETKWATDGTRLDAHRTDSRSRNKNTQGR